jgi:hypothetical protein
MVTAIFGYLPPVSSPSNLGADNLTDALLVPGYFMLGLVPLTILAGLAHDIGRQADRDQTVFQSACVIPAETERCPCDRIPEYMT